MNEIVIDANTGERRRVETKTVEPVQPLFPPDIESRLDAMTADELKQLVRRANAVLGGVLLANKKENLEAIKLRLMNIALTAEVKEALTAINQILNREEGTPAQREIVDMNMNNVQNYGLPSDMVDDMLLRWYEKRQRNKRLTIENTP